MIIFFNEILGYSFEFYYFSDARYFQKIDRGLNYNLIEVFWKMKYLFIKTSPNIALSVLFPRKKKKYPFVFARNNNSSFQIAPPEGRITKRKKKSLASIL